MVQVDSSDFLSCLHLQSDMSRQIESFEWSRTQLGTFDSWEPSLKFVVTQLLSSNLPGLIAWGEDFIHIHNDAFQEIMGTTLLGKNAEELFGVLWQDIYPNCVRVRQSGRSVMLPEVQFNGRFFGLSIGPVRNEASRVCGVLIYFLEKTEEVKLKKLLEEYQFTLSARDEFMSIASHDLKSPLTALKLQTQVQRQLVLKKDPRGFEKDRIRHFSEIVDEQVGRLNRMVDDILEIGRIRRGKIVLNKQEVELGRLVRDTIESVRTHFNVKNFPNVQTKDLVKGVWDQEKIKQVIANLLINAARFGESTPIVVTVEMENEFARLSVIDKGIGIAPENLEQIFERYERVAPKDKPTHGLFLTKKIIDLHNGKIWAESTPGQGSTFIMLLPV